MNTFSKALADTHVADLHHEAARAGTRGAARAARPGISSVAHPVTLRLAAEADAVALASLAALDSSEAPAAPLLIADVGGETLAALSLSDGAVLADPFHPTAALVELLVKRSGQLREDHSPRLRRLRSAVRRLGERRHQRHLLVHTR